MNRMNRIRNIAFSLRGKIILSFLVVVLVGTLVSTVVGIKLVGETIIDQAQNKIKHDLAAARMIYMERLEAIKLIVQNQADRFYLREAFQTGQWDRVRRELERVRKEDGFDVLTLTDKRGIVLIRSRNPFHAGDDQSNDDLVSRALKKESVASTQILPKERLLKEGNGLFEQAYMKFVPSTRTKPRGVDVETSGMMMNAASPVLDEEGRVLGVLYGGILINRNYTVVDRIKEIVYKGERYKGRDTGKASIFQWDLRVSTNVLTPNGNRAIGTRVYESVYDRVLENGSPWTDRALVVNDWLLTAYEPIRDIHGKIIGMLGLGLLEQPYLDMKKQVIASIVKYSFLLSFAVAVVLSLLLERRISRPIEKLARASEEISQGRFDQQVPLESQDEIGRLIASFNQMSVKLSETIKEKDLANAQLRDMNQRYLELLGFATHELMQPLGVLKGFLTMMRDSETGSLDVARQKIAVSVMLRNLDVLINMSRMYLELSKIESGELTVNRERIKIYEEIVRPVIEAEQPRISVKKIRVKVEDEEAFKKVEIDADPVLMRIVYNNLITNALKYGSDGGELNIGFQEEEEHYRFHVKNEGPGIPADKLQVIFEKFVRLESTSRLKKGTGLGLFNTREIIRRHGGEIWAESVEGKWANFIFRIPNKAS